MTADEEITDLHRTRLWLNDATRQVLANGLDLLGRLRTRADVAACALHTRPVPLHAEGYGGPPHWLPCARPTSWS